MAAMLAMQKAKINNIFSILHTFFYTTGNRVQHSAMLGGPGVTEEVLFLLTRLSPKY